MITLNELKKMDRVPLPPNVPNDEHNKVNSLIRMIDSHFNNGMIVVEIGSAMGVSTCCFALKVKKIISIDPYFANHWYVEFGQNTKGFDNIEQIKDYGYNVCSKFEKESVDAVYIDGMHDYENVKRDILDWLPIVKKGGIISGHDYINRTKEETGDQEFGIIKAVNEILGQPDYVFEDTSWLKIKL